MKRFFVTLLIWIIVLSVLMFFLAAFFFDRQHIYRAVLPIAVVFAVITYVFEMQSERMKELEQRVKMMENTLSCEEKTENKGI